MAQEQTAYVGDDIKVLVNVIGSTGAHVVAVIDTTTTRLNGLAAAPTITTIATGVYQIVFSGVTPTPAESDRYTCKVNGTIAGVAWTEYGIPIKIVADERGTDSVVVPTSDITAIKSKTDQLAFTVANEVDSNSLTGGTSPAAIYTEFTSGSNANAFKATGFNTVAPDNASITLILADTNELQTNQGNWLTATGFNTVAPDNASITLILADTNELQTNQGNWLTATGFNAVAPDNAGIASISAVTAKIDTALAADGAVYQYTTNALENGPSDATAATQATIVSHLTDIKGSGFASSDALESIRDRGDSAWTTALLATGAGAVSHEVTINVGGSPESGVDVWVSTDLAGSNVVAGTLSTDAFGKATFSLDVGSYYLWVQKAETNFSNPTSFTVS